MNYESWIRDHGLQNPSHIIKLEHRMIRSIISCCSCLLNLTIICSYKYLPYRVFNRMFFLALFNSIYTTCIHLSTLFSFHTVHLIAKESSTATEYRTRSSVQNVQADILVIFFFSSVACEYVHKPWTCTDILLIKSVDRLVWAMINCRPPRLHFHILKINWEAYQPLS